MIDLSSVAMGPLATQILGDLGAAQVAGIISGHEYLDPRTADTPLGRYHGVTEQILMSQTPGYDTNPLIPHGSHRPEWR